MPVSLKDLTAQLTSELTEANSIITKADTEGRELTSSERASVKAHAERGQAIRKQLTEAKSDDELRQAVTALGADIGLGRTDPRGSAIGGSHGEYIPGTMSRPYRPTGEPWAKSVAEALTEGDGVSKHAPLSPGEPLPVALPAPRLVEMGVPTLWTRDLLPNAAASGGAFRYLQQVRRGWAAAIVPPGQTKPITDPGLNWVNGRVGVVATISEPMNRYDFVDSPALGQFVSDQLTDSVEFGIDDAIVNGTVDPNNPSSTWDGFMVDANVRDLAYDATVTPLDAIRNGMSQIGRAPNWNPTTGMILSEPTWSMLEQLKDDQGRYLLDGPAHDRASRRLWSAPAVVSPTMPDDVVVLGDFSGSVALFVADRGSVNVSYSEFHQDNYGRNLVTWRAEARVALALMMPSAFIRVALAGP